MAQALPVSVDQPPFWFTRNTVPPPITASTARTMSVFTGQTLGRHGCTGIVREWDSGVIPQDYPLSLEQQAHGEFEAVRDVRGRGAARHPGDQVRQPHVADHAGDRLLLVGRL